MMADRTVVSRGTYVVAALALLWAVTVSTALPSPAPGVRRRGLDGPPARSTRLSSKSVPPRAVSAKAVRSEGEEETLGRAAGAAWYPLDTPLSPPRKTPARARAPLSPARPSRPLRC
jgi:hypothetical protein